MKLLFIDACIGNHKPSATKVLCDVFIETLTARLPELEIERLSVLEPDIRPFYGERLTRRDELVASGAFENAMFNRARQFANADRILIGAPCWDLSFPAQLKVYIENIMVSGVTFGYTEVGSEGYCKAEKLMYIATVGGFVGLKDHALAYIRDIAAMLGIPETTGAKAEGLDIIGCDYDGIMNQAKEDIRKIAEVW